MKKTILTTLIALAAVFGIARAAFQDYGTCPNNDFCITGTVASTQPDGYGGFSNIQHYGHGDANFVALKGFGGIALEASSFVNGTRGIISTTQTSDSASSTLFNALWGQATIPTYGLYYADQSPARGLTIRKTATADDGWDQIRLVDHNFAPRFQVYNSGNVKISGNEPSISLNAHSIKSATDGSLRVYTNGVPQLVLNSAVLDLQGHTLTNVKFNEGVPQNPTTPNRWLKVIGQDGSVIWIPGYK